MTALPSPWLRSTEWLADHLNYPDMIVLDATYFLPTQGRNAEEEFLAGHIPGAVNIGDANVVLRNPNTEDFIPLAQLERLLRSKALLLPGLQVSLSVEDGATSEWCFANGMLQYLAEQIDGEAVAPVFSSEKYAAKGDENFPAGSGAAWAI